MFLTITTTHRPATDLGYLLLKNPANVRTVELSFGTAHVFYPEATDERCTAALLVEVDPVGLVRRGNKRRSSSFSLTQYVNDRPYAASSFLSVAITKLFGTALGGKSPDRPELAKQPIPLEVSIPVVPARGGVSLVEDLFEPLGYEVETAPVPLDEQFPEWGNSRYLQLTLRGEQTVADLLAHLYVLLPVLDDDKHYWVAEDEIDKLLAKGGTWLNEHPRKELITKRYLRYQGRMAREALSRLSEDNTDDPDQEAATQDREEQVVERPLSLNKRRIAAVVEALRNSGGRRVLDLGCGEGNLLRALLADQQFEEIVGVDVSVHSLETASQRLRLERMPDRKRERITLMQGALTYRDRRLEGYDAAAVVEVIEHLDPPRLGAFEQCLFGAAQPRTVVVTTPNVEYNVRFEGMDPGKLRHRDHRFEWTRDEFRTWAEAVGERHGYAVELAPIGDVDDEVGPPTQMAVFSR